MFNKNTKKIEINGERETKYFVAGPEKAMSQRQSMTE